MKKMIRFSLLFIAAFLISINISGCTNQSANNQLGTANNDQPDQRENGRGQTSSTTESIAYLPNGEVDTSDWKTYYNDHYDMEIKYPPFLEQYTKPGSDSIFSFKFEEDANWDIQFNSIFPNLQSLSLNEKKNRFINESTRNPTFEAIELDNCFIFYQHNKTKSGYRPGAQIFSSDSIIVGNIQIYSTEYSFEEYDPKYIDAFKAMLESIEFKN